MRPETIVFIGYIIAALAFIAFVAIYRANEAANEPMPTEATIYCPFGNQISAIRHSDQTFTLRCLFDKTDYETTP